ncbi:MAG: DUF294 nucleotidyltransferase-like domain-containing protein [bacterium]|nr:DUF294 nucleotidyltransferase-like domain-containing protein [bacterium]
MTDIYPFNVHQSQGSIAQATEALRVELRKGSRLVGQQWADTADGYVRQLLFLAAKEVGMVPLLTEHAVVVTGSLGRRQATPYSDLEFFIVVSDDKLLAPYHILIDKMWDLSKQITEITNSYTPDVYFRKGSSFNVMTADGEMLPYDSGRDLQGAPVGILFDQIVRNMIEGGRCITGNGQLYSDLCEHARYFTPRKLALAEYKEWVGYARKDFANAFAGGARPTGSIDLKGMILRPVLYTTYCLGRYYRVPGNGDIGHILLLQSKGKISSPVSHLMKKTLDDAQLIRLQLHARHRGEFDEVSFDHPRVKECLRNISALMGMGEAWLKKKKGQAKGTEKLSATFRTMMPLSYDLFRVAQLCK